MGQFLVTNIVLLAAGTLIYLIVRALPRIGEDSAAMETRGVIDRWIASEIPERVDRAMNAVLGKSLRKLKVFFLKIDNMLSGRLKRISGANGNGKSKLDFSEITKEKGVAGEEKLNNN